MEIAGGEIGGGAVHTAGAMTAMARAGEILVSTTVRDIVPGSGLQFVDASDRVPAGASDIPRLLILGGGASVPARRAPTMTQLSPREREILAVLARGMTNAEIATALDLSEHTVKRHVALRSARRKFALMTGLRSRFALRRCSRRFGAF